jgi:DNA-binding IclR family transcriptional regulator
MREEQYTNKALDRALTIIELLAQNKEPMKLQAISERIKIPQSSVLRILQVLIARKYVSQDNDSKKYFLTLKFSYIGDLVGSQIRIRDIVKPFLVSLSEECRESACLAVERDNTAVYIDYVEGPNSILKTLHHIGRTAPLHCTGVGKCLLLNFSAETVERYVKNTGLVPLAKNSIKSKEKLIHEIEDVKDKGYAIDDEECENGVRCIAAPITDYMGKVIASISVTGPASRLTMKQIDDIKGTVMQKAREISDNFFSFSQS